MKRKPAKPASPRPAGAITTPMQRGPAPPPARQPPPKPAASPRPPGVITTPMKAAPVKKPAAKKKTVKRKLAGPGACCVTDACHALTGHWLDAGDDGLFIPDALETLYALGLITGFDEADISETYVSGLILGVDLPGPHAVLTVPGGWWSWGEPYDPATWPDAVVEEAWAVTW